MPASSAALSPAAASRMTWLPPGVDDEVFFPGAGGPAIRAKHGLGERPVVVCVSRLVPRKGQDVLLRAWPSVLRAVPDAVLLAGRWWPVSLPLGAPGGRCGRSAVGDPDRIGAVDRPAGVLRRGERVRDALPHPGGRPRRGRSRHRLPGGVGDAVCRSSRATPAAPPTPSSTARPASSSTAVQWSRWPTGSPPCCSTPLALKRWASGAGSGSARRGAGTTSPSASPRFLPRARWSAPVAARHRRPAVLPAIVVAGVCQRLPARSRRRRRPRRRSRAAMAAMRSPYSTADAPSSRRRASWMFRMNASIWCNLR